MSEDSSLKALIFDADGTLFDSEPWHRLAFNRAFREYGLDWHWNAQEYRRLLMISGGLERMIAYAGECSGNDNPLSADRKQQLADVHERKSQIYRNILRSRDVKPRPGVSRLLAEAKEAGIRSVVASSSGRDNVETALHRCGAGLITYFEQLITADEVGDKKPSPAVYKHALSVLGLPASACMVIEDTQSGCAAAQAAGLNVVITTHALTEGRRFAGACLIVNHMGEPDQPFVVRSGEVFGYTFLNLALMNKILSGKYRACGD